MKRNLLIALALTGALALGSCSPANKFAAGKPNLSDDDVYFTRAKAGDKNDDNNNGQAQDADYTGDDDYYYYGDYASRLGRFARYSPFDYDDDFYYTYVPYNNGFGSGLENLPYSSYINGYAPAATQPINDIGYAYSPYDYGYSPYFNGFDDYGYGDIYAYYIIGGGGGGRYGYHHHHINGAPVLAANASYRGLRTTPAPGLTPLSSLPGRPLDNFNRGLATRTNGIPNNNNQTARQTRDNYQQTARTNAIPAAPTSTSSTSSSGSAVSSGGGGRPVRP